MLFYRYLFRFFVVRFTGLMLLCGLFIFIVSFYELGKRSSPSFSLSVVSKLLFAGLKIPILLDQFLPFVVLLAVFMSVQALQRNQALVALRSLGVAPLRLTLPFTLGAFLLACFSLTLWHPTAVSLLQRYRTSEKKLWGRSLHSPQFLSSGTWVKRRFQDQHLLFRLSKPETLEGITLVIFDKNHVFTARYDAEKMDFSPEKSDAPLSQTSSSALTQSLILSNVRETRAQTWGVFHKKLTLPFALAPLHLMHAQPDPQTLSLWELPFFLNLLESSGIATHPYRLCFLQLLVKPLWMMAMTGLALYLALLTLRLGAATTTLMTLASGFILYIGRDFASVAGLTAQLSPLTAASFPIVFTFFLLSLAFLLHRRLL